MAHSNSTRREHTSQPSPLYKEVLTKSYEAARRAQSPKPQMGAAWAKALCTAPTAKPAQESKQASPACSPSIPSPRPPMGPWAKPLHITATPVSTQENNRTRPAPSPSNVLTGPPKGAWAKPLRITATPLSAEEDHSSPATRLSNTCQRTQNSKHALARRIASLPVEAKQTIINTSLARTTATTLPTLASALITHVKSSYLRGYSARSQAFACTLFAAAALRTRIAFTSALENRGLRLEKEAVVAALHTLWRHRNELMEIVRRYRKVTDLNADFLCEGPEWKEVKEREVRSELHVKVYANRAEKSRRKLAEALKEVGFQQGKRTGSSLRHVVRFDEDF